MGRTLTGNAPDGCCTDCLMWLANGETDPEWTGEQRRDFIARFNRITEGCEVTLGMLAQYHGCAANCTVTDVAGAEYEYDADDADDARWQHGCGPATEVASVTFHELQIADDCECEDLGFSWSACATCGSTLGGNRDAVTFWVEDDKS
jgi:hypothetical protein